MKSLFVLLGSILLATSAGIADEIQLPHVTCFGTAVTEVVPDQMIWSLKVETRGAVLESVAKEHSKTIEGVLRFLKDAKVDAKSIQTSRMEFGENWEERDSGRIRKGFVASMEISFKLADLNQYNSLWLGLAKFPAVSIEAVTYDHSKRTEYRNETREKALLAAREKARAMAKTLGSEIGEPLLVEEDLQLIEGWAMNNTRNVAVQALAFRGDDRDNPRALSLGTIPIQARVRVAFRLVPQKQ